MCVLQKHPELLRLVPKRWANSPLVLSALAFACLILTSCNRAGGDTTVRDEAGASVGQTETESETISDEIIRDEIVWDKTGFEEAFIERDKTLCDVPETWHNRCGDGNSIVLVPRTASQRIAPIFQHGSGRGTFGCVSTASPMFLTEDEARKVIMEEAASAGIRFELDVKTLEAVEIPLAAYAAANNDSDRRTGAAKMRTHRNSLILDGTDRRRNISFEFVSTGDFRKWDFDYYRSRTTVDAIDVRYTAEALRHSLTKTDDTGVVGVFYDPVHYIRYFEPKQTEQDARQASIEDLKKQVRDFIAWLKAEGII